MRFTTHLHSSWRFILICGLSLSFCLIIGVFNLPFLLGASLALLPGSNGESSAVAQALGPQDLLTLVSEGSLLVCMLCFPFLMWVLGVRSLSGACTVREVSLLWNWGRVALILGICGWCLGVASLIGITMGLGALLDPEGLLTQAFRASTWMTTLRWVGLFAYAGVIIGLGCLWLPPVQVTPTHRGLALLGLLACLLLALPTLDTTLVALFSVGALLLEVSILCRSAHLLPPTPRVCIEKPSSSSL